MWVFDAAYEALHRLPGAVAVLFAGKKVQLSPDDYVFAALNLYLDIINLFMYVVAMCCQGCTSILPRPLPPPPLPPRLPPPAPVKAVSSACMRVVFRGVGAFSPFFLTFSFCGCSLRSLPTPHPTRLSDHHLLQVPPQSVW